MKTPLSSGFLKISSDSPVLATVSDIVQASVVYDLSAEEALFLVASGLIDQGSVSVAKEMLEALSQVDSVIADYAMSTLRGLE